MTKYSDVVYRNHSISRTRNDGPQALRVRIMQCLDRGNTVSELRIVGENGPSLACGLKVGMAGRDAYEIISKNFVIMAHDDDHVDFRPCGDRTLLGAIEINTGTQLVRRLSLCHDLEEWATLRS